MSTVILFFLLVFVLIIPVFAIGKAREENEVEFGSYIDTLKIKVEYPGNPDYCNIHLNAIVNESGEYLFDLRKGEIKEGFPAIFYDIIKIAGVTEARPSGLDVYEMTIKRGGCFSFEDEIIPLVIELIKKYYGQGKQIEFLETEDRREAARLRDEAENEYIKRTGHSPYDMY